MGENQEISMFRRFIPSQHTERSKQLASCDAYEWAKIRRSEPFMVGWMQTWRELLDQPYRGITEDGKVRPGLYLLASEGTDHGAPTAAMVKAAEALFEILQPAQREALSYPINATEWRMWMNPEIYIFHHGIRLDEVDEPVVEAVYNLMEASLSPSGYKKARGCMKVNGFLGKVVNGAKVLNERAYNVLVFGKPSQTEPWGWQLYGHHLCINCFVLGGQIVISPVFMGAEPNIIDEGPDKGTLLLDDQEKSALSIMQSLEASVQNRARISSSLAVPDLPASRYHRADQRHLGGAFQDNRTIAYEGVLVTDFTADQQERLLRLIRISLDYLPTVSLDVYMRQIKYHWEETYFCWIGASEPGAAFYYKIHSPVVMIEFDHHTGVFLNNKEPLPFHIHTLVRMPNGNDYGAEILRQYQQRQAK